MLIKKFTAVSFSNHQQKMAARLLFNFFIMMLVLTLLSRMAASLTIAKVTTDTAKTGILTQRYTISGNIETSDTFDIILPSGLRISNTMVQTGDRIHAGDAILKLDLDNIQAVAKYLEEEIQILDKKISSLSSHISNIDAISIQQAENNLKYAQKDYERLLKNFELSNERVKEDLKEALFHYNKTQIALENAKVTAKKSQIETARNNLADANKALNDAEYNRTEAIAVMENALASAKEAQALAETIYDGAIHTLRYAKANLQDAKEQFDSLDKDAAEEEYTAAQNALEAARLQVSNAQNQVDIAANSLSEEAVERAYEDLNRVKTRQNQLISEAEMHVQKASSALADAENQINFNDDALVITAQNAVNSAQIDLKTAKRSYEDISLSFEEQILQAQRAVELAETELLSAKKQAEKAKQLDEAAYKQNEIEKLQYNNEKCQKQNILNQIRELYNQNGIITAPVAGTIKTISNSGITQNGEAAATLFRSDQNFYFTAKIEQKTAEQLAVGDTGTFSYTSGGISQSIQLQISSIGIPNEYGQVRIMAQLDNGSFLNGITGTLEIVKNSDRYSMILPISALRIIDGKTAVLVVRETQSVIGTEQTVEEIDIIIKDQDTKNMAVEAALFPNDQIVIGASKPIKKGDRIRVEN